MSSSPDQIVDRILDGLCTSPFNGVSIDELWTLAGELIKKDDAFYKKLIWSWLIGENDFLVCLPQASAKKAPKIIDREKYSDLDALCDEYEVEKLKFKVDEDRQSIFLTGVPKKNNVLGSKPYELLPYIAKAGEKGITSVDLIKLSGQDKRSLTSRLQVLEDHHYIAKAPTVVAGYRTYIILHFKYLGSMSSLRLRFEKFDMIQNIMDELAKAKNNVRVVADLMTEVNANSSRLDRRRFNSIVRTLCTKGFIEEIVVANENSTRQFIGVKLLKPLPTSAGLDELKEQINNGANSEQDDATLEVVQPEVEEKPPMIRYNTVFPLPNQVYDVAKANPGITAVDMETELNGRYKTRVFSNALSSCTLEEPTGRQDPHQVGRHLCFESKKKFFRLFPLPKYLEIAGKTTTVELLHDVPSLDGDFSRSLIEYCGLEAQTPYKLRCSLVSNRDNDESYFYWNSYKGHKVARLIRAPKKITQFTSTDGNVSVQVSKHGCTILTKRLLPEFVPPPMIDPVLDASLLAKEPDNVEMHTVDVSPVSALESQQKPPELPASQTTAAPLDKPSSFIDMGPQVRRKVLLKMIDEQQYRVVSGALCNEVSKRMKVDYLVDRKTIMRDAIHLESAGSIQIMKRHVGEKRFIVAFISQRNPPSSFDEVFIPQQPAPPKITVRPAPNLTISLDKVKFFIDPVKLFGEDKTESEKQKKAKQNKRKKDKEHTVSGRLKNIDEKLDPASASRVSKKPKESKRPAEDNILTPLMRPIKRKKVASKKKSQPASASHPGMKKTRTNIKIDMDHVQTYIRAVIICQSFTGGQNIDWPKVATVFDERYTSEMLRRQWPKHKRIMGPLGLQQTRRNWEGVLMDAIRAGEITREDLKKEHLPRFLRLWTRMNPNLSTTNANFVLQEDYEENLNSLNFQMYGAQNKADLFKDSLSIIDKEVQYANALFTYPCDANSADDDEMEEPTEVEKARANLKALFATGAEKFSNDKANEVISRSSNKVYTTALGQLEDEKSVAFLGHDSPIKFALTDKLMSVVDCKMDENFFRSAAGLCDVLDEASSVNRGVILSKKAEDGCFAALISLFVDKLATFTRVDQKPPSLTSYSTKSQDRRKLESDFIISDLKRGPPFELAMVAPPTVPACETIWINLNGGFNSIMWLKAVFLLIRCIVFRPGVRFSVLCDRMYPFLEKFEVKMVMDWLMQRKIARRGAYNGFWILPSWYLALHT